MSFGGGSGGGGSIAGSTDVALSSPVDGQVLTYNAALGKWKNAGVVGGSFPGAVYFDTFFAGSTDDQKIAAMNTYNSAQGDGQSGSSIQPVILFGARQYNFSTAIQMYSGMSLVGTKLSNAHGTVVQTKFNWQGTTGTSMLAFTGSQTSQGYPSDGSPRDMFFGNILFNGPSSTHFIENHNPNTDSSAGRVIWYSRFNNCAWSNFQTIWWGWSDGSAVDGSCDISQIGSTAFFLAGAESILFGKETYSQADNTTDTGVPFIRSKLAKSMIGYCLFTGRGATSGISVEGGNNTVIDGFCVDAQSSDPMYGAGIRVSGSTTDGLVITNCSINGVASNPASGQNGASNNKGYIHISGGSQITIAGNNFARGGSAPPATTFPLVYATGVGAGQVKFGYNNWSGWAGAGAVVQQSATGLITNIADPNLAVTTG